MRVKVLTVKQPWASLIVHGIKDIENRSWQTNFRGRVLIIQVQREILLSLVAYSQAKD